MEKEEFLAAVLMAMISGDTEEVQRLKDIFEGMKKSTDNSIKKVGDKVIPHDKNAINYYIDTVTNEQVAKDRVVVSEELIELWCSKDMIVVETGVEKTYKCGHCDRDHHHDIIVFVPAVNKTFYAPSDSFSLVNTEVEV